MSEPTTTIEPTTTTETPATDSPKTYYKGKYKSVEELEKAHGELESKLGAPKTAEEPKTDALKIEPVKEPPVTDEIPDDATVDVVLKRVGVGQDEVVKSWKESGKLSDDQYAKFKKAGYPRAVVDSFLRGQQAEAEAVVAAQSRIKTEAAAIVGSEEQLKNLLADAATFVPADEIEDINARLANPKHFKGAIRDIMEHHRNSVKAGKAKPLVGGQPAMPENTAAFTTQVEMENAMKASTSQYGDWTKDPALMKRMAATPSHLKNKW